MTQTFNTTKLANDRVLVAGLDNMGGQHQVILDAKEFNFLIKQETVEFAGERFDEAVAKFFAPLTEAAEDLKAVADAPTMDEDYLYVINEGQEGVEAREPIVMALKHDTAVLRLLYARDFRRLLWVNLGQESRIEIIAPEEADVPEVAEAAQDEQEPMFSASMTEFLDWVTGGADEELVAADGEGEGNDKDEDDGEAGVPVTA